MNTNLIIDRIETENKKRQKRKKSDDENGIGRLACNKPKKGRR